MNKSSLTWRTWLILSAFWTAETALWIAAYFIVSRLVGGASTPPNYSALVFLFLTSIGIQTQLLRPVWFALGAVVARRIVFLSRGSGLMASYVFALFVTMALSWFWPPEHVFFIQRSGLPSTFWFIVVTGMAVSSLWLLIEKKEPIQPTEPTSTKDRGSF